MATKNTGTHQITQVIESLDQQIAALIQARELLLEKSGSDETRKPRATRSTTAKKTSTKPRRK